MSQLKTMYPPQVNSPTVYTMGAITADSTQVEVTDAAKFDELPLPCPVVLCDEKSPEKAETILLTKIDGSTLTIQRAFQGVAKAWPAMTSVARNFTAYDQTAAQDNIIALNADKAEKSDVTAALAKKVDKVTGKGLSSNDYTTAEKQKLAGLSNYDDTGVKASITAIETKNAAQDTAIAGKVDKVTGKGLSTNDYTTAEKQKLASMQGVTSDEKAAWNAKASPARTEYHTLTAADWTAQEDGTSTQVITLTGTTIVGDPPINIGETPGGMTAELLDAISAAKFLPTSFTASSVTITAFGTPPAVDVPIFVSISD